jgi:hypothetical protein
MISVNRPKRPSAQEDGDQLRDVARLALIFANNLR